VLYRVVAGERRCLGSIIAGKQEIEARVFNEKPKGFNLKLIQWVENTAREDLNLDERLDNVREIIREYQNQHGETEVNATLLKNITGLSLSQTTYYMTVMNAPEDVQSHIRSGQIRNLDKAALLASVTSDEVRARAVEACINGSSLKELRQIISQQKALNRPLRVVTSSQRGRAISRINMGTTFKTEVIKTIVDCVTTQDRFDRYSDIFSNVNWNDLRQTTKAFRKLIELLEVEMAV
jgi:ParB family chromosome partitioning protein